MRKIKKKMDLNHSNKPVHQDVSFLQFLSPIMASVIIIYNHKAWVGPAVNMAWPALR